MSQMIFITLPVTDLARSIAFYEAIGGVKNPQFSDDSSACMVLSETIYVMIMTHEKLRGFTAKRIADAHNEVEVSLCLSRDDRAAVDTFIEAATAAGGKPDPDPAHDYGFMYQRSVEDPDGHNWEATWMDPAMTEARPHEGAGQCV